MSKSCRTMEESGVCRWGVEDFFSIKAHFRGKWRVVDARANTQKCSHTQSAMGGGGDLLFFFPPSLGELKRCKLHIAHTSKAGAARPENASIDGEGRWKKHDVASR